jgi:hypothetical protein
MATKNDITGDALVSRNATKAYLDNYDLIFRRKGNPEKEKENGSTIEPTTPRHGESKNTSQSAN